MRRCHVKSQTAGASVSGLDRKNEYVEVIREPRKAPRASVALERLEATRTGAGGVPASKHSLELICGASCETAAF
jgi:hypothetical protein